MKLPWSCAAVLLMIFYCFFANAEELPQAPEPAKESVGVITVPGNPEVKEREQPPAEPRQEVSPATTPENVPGTGTEGQPQTAEVQREWIHIVSPEDGSQVVAKKPEVKTEFLTTINTDTLLVTLDGADVTGLLTITEKGFVFAPLAVLPAGMHTLSIAATDKDGIQLQKSISFTTRHTKPFEEAYSNNDLSLLYEGALTKPDSAAPIPSSKFEGNLRSDSKLRNNEWQFSLAGNLRFLDQNAPVLSPQVKGVDLINWLFTGSYVKDDLKARVNIGAVQINETQYSVFNLAREGETFTIEKDIFLLNLFSVQSKQFFGQREGLGTDLSDHIDGISAGVSLFDKKALLKAIYVTGGNPGPSFGISTGASNQKGDVLGLILTSDFFQNMMKTEFEGYFSKFDPDTSDEFKAQSDKAYRFKVGGVVDQYNYEALYEHVGADYGVVGNPALPKNKEGGSIRGGATFGVHTVNLMLSRYNDNVRDDPLFPTIYNNQANLDYSFNNIPNLPIGINYQTSLQQSTKEPTGSTPIDLFTNVFTGRVNYMQDPFNIGFQAVYSMMNDRTPANNDTRSITYTLTPTYNIPNLSINPNFSLNKAKNYVTDVTTDTYTITLDLKSKFFRERLCFDLGGTYNIIKADNGSVDTRNLNMNFRLAYNIQKLLKGFLNPSIGLRGTYLKITDRINPSAGRDEFILYLVLATSTPFSF